MTALSSNGYRLIGLATIVALAVLGGWLVGERLAKTDTPANAMVLPEAVTLPEFSLVDQDGERFDREALLGHWSLLFFGFTHCPDICPATLQVLSIARERLAEESVNPPAVILVSVDPDRDTPGILRQYVSHFGDGITGVTGDLAELQKLTSALGIYFAREPQESSAGGYNVAHSAHVVVIDDRGRYAAVFSPPHSVDAFVTDMPRLISGP